jgi:hypothetical protein
MASSTPPTPPPKDTEAEAKPVSSASSTTRTSPVPALPLRPTLLDRYQYLSCLLFRRPHYLHPSLTRERLFPSLVILVLLLLLLTILLPAILLTRHHTTTVISFPTSGTTFTGDGTYYDPGLGACGITSGADDMVVAIGWALFDALANGTSNPNLNPACGRKILAHREGEEETVEVEVVDRCVGCGVDDLDFSLTAFEKIAEEWEGRVKVVWAWKE